ncbi:EAL domain-containing protein [Vibrio sp. 10N.261.55.A7]|uniref:putative bifunctional diguanylate cyclase/phosphodiesterase n=1 Tax=Vibrio TaxID=662 RepID=UPI000C8323EB|nr:EAL domain-containing protein [Vibrio sp. 10N.261.55.A7]PMJ91902.1 diguanylate cyclase [Vibrio sp. 10N.261.55.A7]
MKAKRLFLLTVTLAGIIISLTTLLFAQANKLLTEKAPLIEASQEIKINGTLAHLWFEEVMSGDATQSVQEVWYYLDLADWHTLALLEGGRSIQGDFKPIQDPALRIILVSMRDTLVKFRNEALLRHQNKDISSAGSAIDIRSDEMFLDFIQEADDVQRAVKMHLEEGIQRYQYISIMLIMVSIASVAYLYRVLNKFEENRTVWVESLSKANESIAAKNEQLHNQAHYDSLTKLPNRVMFLESLEKSVSRASRLKNTFAVLFIDLDHFKTVNDQYGHDIGDKLLKSVATRINHCIRDSDTAARISGDEFVVVLEHLNDVQKATNAASKIAKSLNKALQRPFQINDVCASISASIGIAIYPDDSMNSDSLMRYADNAMYHAKSLGKNNFQFYSEELNRISMSRIEIERDLKIAIKRDQFTLYYLPKWELRSGKIVGVEALLRWFHPTKGMICPDAFIPIAESTGLIRELDLMVLSKSIEQQKEWQARGIDTGTMAINVSAKSLKNQAFFEQLKRIVIDSGVDTTSLELEITESVLIENAEQAKVIFKELKQLGVRLALDDFGTGFSSLSYLKEFDFQTLKIDRSFVADYRESAKSMVLLKNILNLGRELGLDVVAEGVETSKQQEDLQDFGCLIGQGYFMTNPQPASILIKRLFSANLAKVQYLRKVS